MKKYLFCVLAFIWAACFLVRIPGELALHEVGYDFEHYVTTCTNEMQCKAGLVERYKKFYRLAMSDYSSASLIVLAADINASMYFFAVA